VDSAALQFGTTDCLRRSSRVTRPVSSHSASSAYPSSRGQLEKQAEEGTLLLEAAASSYY
jgi:hypothetical protein